MVPGRTVDLSKDALAIAVAAVVFLVVNDTLVTVVISLSGRSFLHEWAASFREMGILYISMAPLGALLAFAYQDSRWNVLYFPFLILVIYNGFKLYANLQSETDHALVLLADTVDKRDEYTYAHSQRVAEYAGEIARTLDLPRKEIDLIVSAAASTTSARSRPTTASFTSRRRSPMKSARRSSPTQPTAASSPVNSACIARAATTSATITNAGTAAVTPTASPARTSRTARASSPWPTPTTR